MKLYEGSDVGDKVMVPCKVISSNEFGCVVLELPGKKEVSLINQDLRKKGVKIKFGKPTKR